MDFKTMKIEDIINWCKENNQVEWLKAEVEKKVPYKVFPRKTVVGEDGKKKSVVDKTQEPTIEQRPISFIQIKTDFTRKFMPEIAPKQKEKKPTMYDIIKAL